MQVRADPEPCRLWVVGAMFASLVRSENPTFPLSNRPLRFPPPHGTATSPDPESR